MPVLCSTKAQEVAGASPTLAMEPAIVSQAIAIVEKKVRNLEKRKVSWGY